MHPPFDANTRQSLRSPDEQRITKMLTACMLTPAGRGAVATIGIAGNLSLVEPLFHAANGKSLLDFPIGRICFGDWGEADCEDVLLIRTGAETAEIHCHGGTAAVERVLQDIARRGGNRVDHQAWMQREWSQVAAECELALAQATTLRTATHLLRQRTLLPTAFEAVEQLTGSERAALIERMLTWSNFGLHLTAPWKVVLCGRPNVGKSSLINALVGYTRSVVFDQPGTTRDVVAVETAFSGWPFELSDTAGLRVTSGVLEAAGIEMARERIEAADVVVIVLDGGIGLQDDDRELIASCPDAIVVWNKSDLASARTMPDLPVSAIAASAVTRAGLEELMQAIVGKAIPAEPVMDLPFPVTITQRNRLLSLLGSDSAIQNVAGPL